MTIDELKAKHFWNVQLADKYSHLLREDEIYLTDNHTYLSIQFAIEVLKDLEFRADLMIDMSSKTHGYRFMQDKIKELKEYLDEKV